MLIHKKEIPQGAKDIVKLPVGQLPSGNKIIVQAHVFRAKEPGPTMLVLGGVHGDEINGVEIVRRALQLGYFENLLKGSVIAIPLLNIYGFINFSRDVPDGKDVNRSFPGNSTGSLASRVAYVLNRRILPNIDFGIDFHTGGRSHYNFPQLRYSKDDESEQLARAFAAPFLIEAKPIPKSLRRVAHDIKRPILVFEGGENLRYDGFSLAKGLAGIQRVMKYKEMIAAAPAPENSRIFKNTKWIRSPRGGMFLWYKCAGSPVEKGECLGVINDPYGMQPEIRILAKTPGYLIGHNNAPVVNSGDALFNLAYEKE